MSNPRQVRKYLSWAEAGGPNECRHGYAAGLACPECDKAFEAVKARFSKAGEQVNRMRLTAPPPVTFADALVPGGPVYFLPPWWLRWPWPIPAPPPPPVIPPPLPLPPSDAVAVVDALNRERTTRGITRLIVDAKLAGVAQSWSHWQATNGPHGTLTHGPVGSFARRIATVYPGVEAGEIIAEGASTVAEVVAMWMNSPPHKANILDPHFTAAGAGLAVARDGTPYHVVDFVR